MFMLLGVLAIVGGLAFLPTAEEALPTDAHQRVDHEGLATNRAHPYWLEQTPECPASHDVYCTGPGEETL